MKMDNLQWQDIDGALVATNDIHKFGTDAVLLENFALKHAATKICDLGAGCGIVSFLVSKRKKKCKLVALEIQEDAARLIEASKEKNKTENLKVVCADARDVQMLKKEVGNADFDLVICNPPYYKEKSGAKSPYEERAIAREENTLSIYDVALIAKTLLKHGGRLCVCFKPERLSELFDAMKKNTIEPKTMRMVYTSIDKKPWLVLVEGKKGAAPFLEVLPPLVMGSESGKNELEKIYSCVGCE